MRRSPLVFLLAGAGALGVLVAALALLVQGNGASEPLVRGGEAPSASAEGSLTAGEPAPSMPAPTLADALAEAMECLEKAGAKVGALERTDSRRAALADLAQRTSIEARFGERWVALGFTRNARQAQLLADLLTVPEDPYVVRVEGDVVTMYSPEADQEAEAARDCVTATT